MIDFQITQQELKDALFFMAFNKGAKNPNKPIIDSILFHVEAPNRLSLTSTDLTVQIQSFASVEPVIDSFSFTLENKKIIKLIGSIDDSNALIRFTSQDNGKIKISCGKSKFILSSFAVEDFPVVEPSTIEHEFIIESKTLHRLLKSIHPCMPKQDARPNLNGVNFELSEGKLMVVATDGHRMGIDECEIDFNIEQPVSFIVPAKAIDHMLTLFNSENIMIKLAFGGNHLRFQTPAYSYQVTLVNKDYPDFKRVIPYANDVPVTLDTSEFQNMLKMSSLVEMDVPAVMFDFKDNTLTTVARNSLNEESVNQMLADFEGNLKIGFNVNYMLDAVKQVEGEKVTLNIKDSNTSALIKDNTRQYVIMPMRL